MFLTQQISLCSFTWLVAVIHKKYLNIIWLYLQSLVISIMSYMGVLRVTLKTEKDFIDEHKLKSCMQSAFDKILQAAMEITKH